MRRVVICILSIVTLLICEQALADRRIALVIGNSQYKHTAPLENPRNDAEDIGNALEQLGFDVIRGFDLNYTGMNRAVRDFAERLRGAKVGLFYYAGHGLQVAGQNYLAPIDAELTSSAALDFELVRLDLIHRTMERETSTTILLLDACRDNPLARNLARSLGTRSSQIGRGLASVESGEGTLISFSTQPGNVALDGQGRNSPYAAALKRSILVLGDDLSTILVNVRNDVMQATSRRQVPWEHSALTARFYFTEPTATEAQHAELQLWESVKESNDPTVVASYLRRYPHGAFAVVARSLVEALEKQKQLEQEIAAGRHQATEQLKQELNDLRKAQEAARNPTAQGRPNPDTATAALPDQKSGPIAQQPFDGIWRLETAGNAGCPTPRATGKWVISRGTLEARGRGPGTVTADGTFKFRTQGRADPEATVVFSGKLKGNAGSGSFYVEGRGCKGTITLSREHQNPS